MSYVPETNFKNCLSEQKFCKLGGYHLECYGGRTFASPIHEAPMRTAGCVVLPPVKNVLHDNHLIRKALQMCHLIFAHGQ